jgi:8-oxo-dGTP pyrophosphatase MutT (NUDIX family)
MVTRLGNIRVTFDRCAIPKDFDAVVVILFCNEKLVWVWNPERGWEFPGGHREGDETYNETAIREVLEETQIRIEALEVLGYYTRNREHVTLILSADCPSSDMPDATKIPSGIIVMDEWPSGLSYGDGREQLFLEMARKSREQG